MEPERISVTGLILAGGRARRMDGVDKGLLEIGATTMVSRIAGQLQQQCAGLIINANRNREKYAALGHPVYPDVLPDYQGPLSGMYTGLSHISTEWMITAPCDGPFVADDYVTRMAGELQSRGCRLAVASCDTRLQPVYALMHISLREDLDEFLKTGERKIDRWYCRHDYAVVDFSHYAEMFENINTPQQLQDLCQLLQSNSTG
jgi:molybdopterin-guanine dinucleotide biosynthesis protein A